MENKKLTKKEKFAMVKEYVLDNPMLVEFLDNEIDLLNKKASSSAKTKTQKDNEIIKERILGILNANRDNQYTISEFQATFEEFSIDKYTNQKLNALFTQLKNEGKIERVQDKKKSYFRAR